MERILNIRIEKLTEGVYLATSDDIQGLVAQGRTIAETIEIAEDVARILLEEQDQSAGRIALSGVVTRLACQIETSNSAINL